MTEHTGRLHATDEHGRVVIDAVTTLSDDALWDMLVAALFGKSVTTEHADGTCTHTWTEVSGDLDEDSD